MLKWIPVEAWTRWFDFIDKRPRFRKFVPRRLK